MNPHRDRRVLRSNQHHLHRQKQQAIRGIRHAHHVPTVGLSPGEVVQCRVPLLENPDEYTIRPCLVVSDHGETVRIQPLTTRTRAAARWDLDSMDPTAQNGLRRTSYIRRDSHDIPRTDVLRRLGESGKRS